MALSKIRFLKSCNAAGPQMIHDLLHGRAGSGVNIRT